MSDARNERIHDLFAAALERPAEQREAFLAEASGGDVELAGEVRELLESAAEAFAEVAESLGESRAELRPAGLVGERLDDFELGEELGRGTSGIVYRAHQVSRDREVAVKVLTPLPGDNLSRAAERFKREAIAASRLRHPAIVPIFYYGHALGRDYYAMELVDGPSLDQQVEQLNSLPQGQPPVQPPDLRDPHEAARLIAQLARGLDYSHSLQIIHRDVKPQNILIDRDGRPRLTDFGLAKNLELAGLTRTGDLAGTPNYMAPEQAMRVLGPIDARTDVYSLGAVLYEMLCGQPPAVGDSLTEVLLAIAERPVTEVDRIGNGIPRQLALVCMKALRREPEKRYQSAGEFARDLESFMEGRRVDARPPTVVDRIRERTLDRRSLLRLVPAAAVVGAAAMAGAGGIRRRVNAANRAPRLTVDGAGPARVSLIPVDGELLPSGRPQEAGLLRSGEALSTAAPGSYHVFLEDAQGRRVDYFRELREATTVTLRPTFDREGSSMVAIGGGRLRIDAIVEDAADPTEREFEVAPFELDEALVTNGDFRAFLADTERETLPYWSKHWTQYWFDPPRADWESLPVVNVNWSDAEACANWMGKRLPTRLELAWAGLHDEAWLDSEAALDPSRFFVLGRDSFIEVAGGRSTLDAYVAFVEPARAPGRSHSPGGNLYHLLGNVAEWSATPVRRRAGPTMAPTLERHLRSGAWHGLGSPRTADQLFRFLGGKDQDGASPDVGFRCARSVRV